MPRPRLRHAGRRASKESRQESRGRGGGRGRRKRKGQTRRGRRGRRGRRRRGFVAVVGSAESCAGAGVQRRAGDEAVRARSDVRVEAATEPEGDQQCGWFSCDCYVDCNRGGGGGYRRGNDRHRSRIGLIAACCGICLPGRGKHAGLVAWAGTQQLRGPTAVPVLRPTLPESLRCVDAWVGLFSGVFRSLARFLFLFSRRQDRSIGAPPAPPTHPPHWNQVVTPFAQRTQPAPNPLVGKSGAAWNTDLTRLEKA